jgi:hypothetical protein
VEAAAPAAPAGNLPATPLYGERDAIAVMPRVSI